MHLFLYGTLLHGACNAVADALHRTLRPGLPATVAGRLFALSDPCGWYPALVPGEGRVAGMVHAAGPGFDAAALTRLDAYEGFDSAVPAVSEYVRAPVMARLEVGGGEIEAQAYLYHAPLPHGAVPIAGGDFRDFLERTGLPGYRLPFHEAKSDRTWP